jgi:hypothetical protein
MDRTEKLTRLALMARLQEPAMATIPWQPTGYSSHGEGTFDASEDQLVLEQLEQELRTQSEPVSVLTLPGSPTALWLKSYGCDSRLCPNGYVLFPQVARSLWEQALCATGRPIHHG